MAVHLEPLQLALKNLEDALSKSNLTDLERDGAVQRFEYCYELTWKMAQRVLKENEVTAETPKSVFRELGRLGWISNVEEWIEFQNSRNQTSHEYGESLAIKSMQLARKFLPNAKSLFNILKTK